jgi:hypothetical protein
MDFLKAKGVVVVGFERGEVAAGALFPGATFVVPDPNAPEFNTFGTHGQDEFTSD